MHATRRDSLGNAITQENKKSFYNTCPLDDIPQNNETDHVPHAQQQKQPQQQRKPKPAYIVAQANRTQRQRFKEKPGLDTGPNKNLEPTLQNEATTQGQTKTTRAHTLITGTQGQPKYESPTSNKKQNDDNHTQQHSNN